MSLCTISITAKTAAGAALAGAVLTFTRTPGDRLTTDAGAAVWPLAVQVTCDASGLGSVSLIPGDYVLQTVGPTGSMRQLISVPDVVETTLDALLEGWFSSTPDLDTVDVANDIVVIGADGPGRQTFLDLAVQLAANGAVKVRLDEIDGLAAALEALGIRTSALQMHGGPAAFPQIVDASGAELLGFDVDGRAILRFSDAAISDLLVAIAAQIPATDPAAGYPSLKDADGIELFGFDSLGRARMVVSQDVANQVLRLIDISGLYDPEAAGLLAASDILLLGDSMSTPTVRDAIASALGGRTVSALAFGGATAAVMAVALGAAPLTVTVSGNAIPASGAVAVTAKSHNILASGGSFTGTFRGSIVGVTGVMTTDASGNWTFTRDSAGSVTAAPAGSACVLDPDTGTAWIPATSAYRGRTAVLRLGRNGLKSTRAERNANTLDPLRAIIAFLTPRFKRVVVIGPYNGRAKDWSTGLDNEPAGSVAYLQYMDLINEMQREFGPAFFDLRTAAVKNAIYDLSVTPDANDLADVAQDCIPRSLFSTGDNTHVSTTMQGWEGAFIAKHLLARGY